MAGFKLGQRFVSKRTAGQIAEVVETANDGQQGALQRRDINGDTVRLPGWTEYAAFTENWGLIALDTGTKIECSSHHDCGQVISPVVSGEPIEQKNLLIDATLGTGIALEYLCRDCEEPVARYKDGQYEISTDKGWVGPLV